MDEDEDGARGSIDDEGSGTGYESASDASMTGKSIAGKWSHLRTMKENFRKRR